MSRPAMLLLTKAVAACHSGWPHPGPLPAAEEPLHPGPWPGPTRSPSPACAQARPVTRCWLQRQPEHPHSPSTAPAEGAGGPGPLLCRGLCPSWAPSRRPSAGVCLHLVTATLTQGRQRAGILTGGAHADLLSHTLSSCNGEGQHRQKADSACSQPLRTSGRDAKRRSRARAGRAAAWRASPRPFLPPVQGNTDDGMSRAN